MTLGPHEDSPPTTEFGPSPFSAAGFGELSGSGREAWNFGTGWRFHRGTHPGAELPDFDDDDWPLVNLPHGVDGALPEEASGCSNYQGTAVYRKRFTPPASLTGKQTRVVFEGILGRSRIWLNGVFVHENVSGFLPAIVDVTQWLRCGERNSIVVVADNSDDPSFPPGKAQAQLDYAYFGGIYRGVTFLATSSVYITDANEVEVTAGGGIFARTYSLSAEQAEIDVSVHVANALSGTVSVQVAIELAGPDGAVAARSHELIALPASGAGTSEHRLVVDDPLPWSPDTPELYDLRVRLLTPDGEPLDGVRLRYGIRTLQLDPDAGLMLNGAPLRHKLLGVNRHQDHAVLGFALPDSLHRRDARLLRDAGVRVVRSAHYPQSRAFMDACDELGIFVIVNTPGWQFWNENPVFAARVYSDIRNLVRRDRNHACILFWEPVLNETNYSVEFATTAHTITHEEYPYPGCIAAADEHAGGSEIFEVQFGHPAANDAERATRAAGGKGWFTREWGDNVDDWSAHNSPSRAARAWGEGPQLTQAEQYAKPPFAFTSLDSLCHTPPTHIGGTLWHAFDHQRGYHPDPFFGGITDAFRLPKYSYHLFRAQRPPTVILRNAESGPMVFIAHEMTPFSPRDVTVFSNCEEVRLSWGDEVISRRPVPREPNGMPSPAVLFPELFDFMAFKRLARSGRAEEYTLVAEGLIGGDVVARHSVAPAGRAEQVRLRLQRLGVDPVADGSDVITVVASVTDRVGRVRRLNDGAIEFHVSGAGELVGSAAVGANPRVVRWGEAAAIVRMSSTAGRIRVIADYVPRGVQMPRSAVLEFDSAGASVRSLHDESPSIGSPISISDADVDRVRLEFEAKDRQLLRNQEVAEQQEEFEGGARSR